MEYWQLDELSEEEHIYSVSSCVGNIIATRFIHSFVVLDVNTGEILWLKQSEKPDNFHEVAQIGFSPPVISKVGENTYKVLYSLDDQIGLLEINTSD